MLHKHKPSQKQLITGIIHEAISAPDGTLIVQAVAQTHMPTLFYQQVLTLLPSVGSSKAKQWISGSLAVMSSAYRSWGRLKTCPFA
jgi:hypothetical protein